MSTEAGVNAVAPTVPDLRLSANSLTTTPRGFIRLIAEVLSNRFYRASLLRRARGPT